MVLVHHEGGDDATDDSSNALKEEGDTEQVLASKFGISPCLDNQNSIDDNIAEGHGQTGCKQQHGHRESICYFKLEKHIHHDCLQKPKENQVWFSFQTAEFDVVANQAKEDLEWPGQVDDAIIDGHIPWILLQVSLEQVLRSKLDKDPETKIKVLYY